MKIKFKKTILQDVNNEMTTYKKYLVSGQIYNDTNTKYKRFKFVQIIYKDDIFEYLEKDKITKKEFNETTNELIHNIIDFYLPDYDNTRNFYEFCNETINDYNKYIHNLKFGFVV